MGWAKSALLSSLLVKLMLERMAGNDELVTRCLNDPDFQEIVFTGLLPEIFDAVAAQQTP